MPSAAESAATSVPAATVVTPSQAALAPLSVSVPVPALTNRLAPAPVIVPLNTVELLSPPAVSTLPASATPPAPANEPTASVPPICSDAPAATVTALASAMRSLPLVASTPWLTAVVPL